MAIITAVICTYNRASYLKAALLSLVDQTLPKTDFEVIVVDNASCDNTAKIAHSFSDRLKLSYIFESQIGLSQARNAGLHACQTQFIAFLDDDALAFPDWLEKIIFAFENHIPNPSIVGGRVFLKWSDGQPGWIPNKFLSLYSRLDYGELSRFISPNEYLVGANLSFNTGFLRSIGGFELGLGRKGKSLLSGEETRVLELARLLNLGIYYESQAEVWHQVVPERQTRGWLVRRVFWDGASQPLLDYGSGQSGKFYARRAFFELRQAVFYLFSTFFFVKRQNDNFWSSVQRFGRFYMNVNLLMASTSRKGN